MLGARQGENVRFAQLLVALLAIASGARGTAGEPEEPSWLAAVFLQHREFLQLSAEQRNQLEFVFRRAEATWQALTQRMMAAERDTTARGRSDWFLLARERGQLRVFADRDALRVLDPHQRARWRELTSVRKE